jgi:hypothetical protein
MYMCGRKTYTCQTTLSNDVLRYGKHGFMLFVLGVKRPGVKLTTQFQLLQRLRMSGAMPLIPLRFYDVKTDDVTCDFKTKYVYLYFCCKTLLLRLDINYHMKVEL